MKNFDGPSKGIFVYLMFLSLLLFYTCFVYHNYVVYNSINVVVKKNTSIEYGSANYDINEFIKTVEGEIVSIQDNVDTNVVGEHEVLLTVKKENITKEVPIVLTVVDTAAPEIEVKEDKVTITSGDDYDLTSNIEAVRDTVDGAISYLGDVGEDSVLYYNFDYDTNTIDDVGEHEVKVTAKDKNGNETVHSFVLEVVAPPPPPAPVYSFRQTVYNDLPANASGNDIVSIAYSLIGSAYASGANGPYSFDCSGFVQYVYSRVGISVSRSSYTQAYDGVAVSYESAQPGDILNWGHGGSVTHSALYVGNGQMIHATNPRQGVVLSNVAAWDNGSIDNLMGVRRIQ